MFASIEEIRAQFPALVQQVYGQNLVYLDNSATTQKPLHVLEVLQQMNSQTNGNIHRAVHYLSNQCTQRYEQAREQVRDFIRADSAREVLFTAGTTMALNLLAYSLGETFLHTGDTVVLTQAEHHSNIVPWQMLAQRKGVRLEVVPVLDNGTLDGQALEKALQKRPKLLTIAHISNVLGLVNPIREIADLAHQYGVMVAVDGAQGIVHAPVDVQALGADFYAFSGHKLYGPTGIGVLYGKAELLEAMVPWQGGGDMIESVSLTRGTTYAPLPLKFEAGTANYIGAVALGAACAFLREIDPSWRHAHEQQLVMRGLERLKEIDGLELLGTGLPEAGAGVAAGAPYAKVPLFSFTVQGAHPNDLALLLDQMGIAVRSGQLCAEPLLERFGHTAVLRASFGIYNTVEELDYFIDSLKKAVRLLR